MSNATKIEKSAAELKVELTAKVSEMELKVAALKDLLNAEDAPAKDIVKARDEAQTAVSEWNELNIQHIYATCYEMENPMLAACKHGEVTEKRLQEKKNENGTITVVVNDRKARNAIDLVDFDVRYNGQGHLARNGQWMFYAEELAKAMGKEVGKGLELSPADQKKLLESYKDALEDEKFFCLTAKKYSIGNITKDLQALVDMILFIPDPEHPELNQLKVFSKDARYVEARKAKAGKTALGTRTIKGKEMRTVICNVMYHLATGNPYVVE